ncbi:uncharacterized protein METZ01_LOCUS67986, partial [marine metagenome]
MSVNITSGKEPGDSIDDNTPPEERI